MSLLVVITHIHALVVPREPPQSAQVLFSQYLSVEQSQINQGVPEYDYFGGHGPKRLRTTALKWAKVYVRGFQQVVPGRVPGGPQLNGELITKWTLIVIDL